MPSLPSVRTLCSSVLRDWSARADTAHSRRVPGSRASPTHAARARGHPSLPASFPAGPKRNVRCVINETRRGLLSYRSWERPRAALSVLTADTGAGRAAARPAPRVDRPGGRGEPARPARAPPRPALPSLLPWQRYLTGRQSQRGGSERVGAGCVAGRGPRCGHGGADPAPAAVTVSRRPPCLLHPPPTEK